MAHRVAVVSLGSEGLIPASDKLVDVRGPGLEHMGLAAPARVDIWSEGSIIQIDIYILVSLILCTLNPIFYSAVENDSKIS